MSAKTRSESSHVGERFQERTRYRRDHLPGRPLDWQSQPEPYKEYPDAARVSLPAPHLAGGQPLWSVLKRRRSVRRYAEGAITMEELSQLLWASQGITRYRQGFGFRTAPSAGALYPIETYIIANAVESLESGAYHYSVPRHTLDTLRLGDLAAEAAHAALDQRICLDAPLVFVWTAVYERSKWKYGQRAYRYIYLDAGHIAQNMALAAVSLGLGTCQIGALYDDEVNALVSVDGQKESAIYMSTVGRQKDLGGHP